MFGSPLCAVGTKLFLFAFFVAWSFCLDVTRVVSRLNHPAGSIFCAFFVVAALCFSFESNSCPYFAARGFLVGLQGTCNAGVFFRSCWWHLEVSALSVCTPSSLPLRASCCFGLFCLMSLALFVSPAPPSLDSPWSRMVFAWATVMDSRFFEYVVLESLGSCEHRDGFWLVFFLPPLLPAGCSFLPPDVCQGFFPVARSSDPDIVPCIDGDDGASCAEAGWRVCLCSACLTGPNGVIRLSLFLLTLVEIRGRFCAWAFPAWHAGPRVVRELILFCLCPLCVPLFLVPAFKLPSVCLPVPRDTSGIFERWYAWSRNVTSVYGIFFSVAVFSVLVLGRFSDLSLCCLWQSPVWVPRLFCWGMCGTVYRVFGSTLESRERESFSLLVDWDDQQLLNAGLHLSRPRTVIFWCGSNRCQQLLLSLDLLCEFSLLLCVFVWRGILSWLLFVWCCGCLAAGHLACRNDVAPASAWKLLFLGSASICDSSQLASSLHGLEFPIYWLCPNKNTHQKWENCVKKKRRNKKQTKKRHMRKIMKKRRTIKM